MGAREIGPTGVDEQHINETIGARVHAAMWSARITQTRLAEAMGVDQAAVSRRLRGKAPWKVSDLIIAAQLCGVALEDLMPTREELGQIGALTRGYLGSESRCTPARANRTPLERAAQTWGLAGVIAGEVAA